MSKKSLQIQRKKKYFIDSAIHIIKHEGVSNLTAKKVAELAGYASGTLYNYFKNLNELLFYCVEEFFSECMEYVLTEHEKCKTAEEKVVRTSIAYSHYFTSNPHIFQVVFLEDMGDPPAEISGGGHYLPEIVKLSINNLHECVKEGVIREVDVEMKQRIISNTVHANILFYIKQRQVMSQVEVLEKIKSEITYILN
ncbi:TetR/AcrR family transcriptional regulator [Haloplasma contractile]|uniref:Transcriptional regulator TetR family protein n=1 Tax=Haloplasma contractile SSD-17B TaxID=1033810 RepID=F7Q0Y5_9MOLU|nr:TetR/AcrR family transcriptional regulator [Haloplasma contractile]ERJ11364.1 Transcriptional regulator TetR family protein [Haloplasma contractile SSD-17B]